MPKAIDLTGKKFGDLTVVEMLHNYQNKKKTYCRCIDNNQEEVIVRQDALQSGATKTVSGSKNKGQYKDLTDMIFGRLKVLSLSNKRAKNGTCIWTCICDCGNLCEANSGDLVRGRVTSCGCNVQEYYDSLAVDISGKKFGLLTAIEFYKRIGSPGNFKRVWRCKCDCGNETFVAISDLTSGNTMSCGCKKVSHGEAYITSLLQDNNIKFIPQYTFIDCKNVHLLPFDFYLPEYNICIEYDGAQHFISVDYFGGEDGFKKRQKNDDIKTKYCLIHNIKLIRIPYTYTKKEITKCILNILSPVTITA